ncbi:DUF3800 domain-containing protein [Rhodocista pekingensis]|uniref:DUF3800 domain-containing protein n=1 Tax=Rhodocista pekingensis TaxID=201185 RepID=A0ABW2KVL0_9PROT
MGATPTFDLYVDDSGSRMPDRVAPLPRADGVDAFALGGFMIPAEQAGMVHAEVANLVGRYDLAGPLHSHEIRCRKGVFAWLGQDRDRAARFQADLSDLIARLPIHVTACVVHRPGYNARYRALYGDGRWRLCRSAYQILVERCAKIAAAQDRMLKVFVEACGKREDRDIRDYHARLIQTGADFDKGTSGKYDPLLASGFARTLVRNPTFIRKSNPMGQIADILLWPVVKGCYDPDYRPFRHLVAHSKLIDRTLAHGLVNCGIKYYCFDPEAPAVTSVGTVGSTL